MPPNLSRTANNTAGADHKRHHRRLSGPGRQGVIPAKTLAKLSFRLVPDQDPSKVERLFRAHVAKIVPATMRVDIRTLSAAQALTLPTIAVRVLLGPSDRLEPGARWVNS